jgi:hypothetical protein
VGHRPPRRRELGRLRAEVRLILHGERGHADRPGAPARSRRG